MRIIGRFLLGLLPLILILSTATQTAAQSTTVTTKTNIAKLIKQAESGDKFAQYDLGVAYAKGEGISKDEVQAVHWYHKAAEQGYVKAQASLGLMYAIGQGVAQDDAEAVRWYRKAAELGDPVAKYNLGFMYANGRGVAKDEVEATRWIHEAAEQGYAQAQFNLGMMYADADEIGVAQDGAQAYFWLNLVAKTSADGTRSTIADEARSALDHVGAKLTPEKRLQIQELCRKWAEAHPQYRE